MRFGLAVRDITPPFRLPMYGYGARKDVFDDAYDPLTFTALVLEENGRRALIGAADLGAFPLDGSLEKLRDRTAEIIGCPRDNILFNASHSHGTPLVPMGDLTFHGGTERHPAVPRYRDWLYDQILAAAEQAAAELREGTLTVVEGQTRLPMNRRPDRNGAVPNAPNPAGPVDERLLAFLVHDAGEALVALGLRLSCHPVATGAQHRLTADFPGAWRRAVLAAFQQKVIPFFWQGVGADARPRAVAAGDHWREMPHAELEDLGRELWAETLQALAGPRRTPLGPLVLEGRITPAPLSCKPLWSNREQLEALAADPSMTAYVNACRRRLDAGKTVSERPVFHVQTLWLDEQTALIGIDGEVLNAAGTFIEQSLAPRRGIVLGYSNGTLGYLPDTAELARGGYEAEWWKHAPWAGPFRPGLEKELAGAVYRR